MAIYMLAEQSGRVQMVIDETHTGFSASGNMWNCFLFAIVLNEGTVEFNREFGIIIKNIK